MMFDTIEYPLLVFHWIVQLQIMCPTVFSLYLSDILCSLESVKITVLCSPSNVSASFTVLRC
jgi:hypothetical protein